MLATYGAYDHDGQHVAIRACNRQTEWNKQTGAVIGSFVALTVEFTLYGSTQDALDTKIAAARTAYSTHGQNFIAKLDSGADSDHKYLNSSYGPTGIRVARFGYADGAEPLQHATRRTLKVDLVCGEPLEDSASSTPGGGTPPAGDVEAVDPGTSPVGPAFVYRFEEAITVSGGIPSYRIIPMPGGPSLAFQEAASTPEITDIRGRAEATGGFAADPSTPAGLLLDKSITKGRIAGQPASFFVAWAITVAN